MSPATATPGVFPSSDEGPATPCHRAPTKPRRSWDLGRRPGPPTPSSSVQPAPRSWTSRPSAGPLGPGGSPPGFAGGPPGPASTAAGPGGSPPGFAGSPAGLPSGSAEGPPGPQSGSGFAAWCPDTPPTSPRSRGGGRGGSDGGAPGVWSGRDGWDRGARPSAGPDGCPPFGALVALASGAGPSSGSPVLDRAAGPA